MNRQVGTQTGTIQVAAEFPNPDAVLRPGGFGRVRFQTADNPNALLVPQPAVIEIQGQYQIIVLTPTTRRCSVRSKWATASAPTGSSPKA